MNISLPPELEKFVTHEIELGHYQTASEVIRAGLLRLKADWTKIQRPELPDSHEELEQQLLVSIDELDKGNGIDGKESLRRMLAKVEKYRSSHA